MPLAVGQGEEAAAADALAEDGDDGAGDGRSAGALDPAHQAPTVVGERPGAHHGMDEDGGDDGPPETAAGTQRAVLQRDVRPVGIFDRIKGRGLCQHQRGHPGPPPPFGSCGRRRRVL